MNGLETDFFTVQLNNKGYTSESVAEFESACRKERFLHVAIDTVKVSSDAIEVSCEYDTEFSETNIRRSVTFCLRRLANRLLKTE